MADRTAGLEHRYNVERIDGKPVGPGIFLEYDDPNSLPALAVWADTVEADGFAQLASDVRAKVQEADRA